MESTGFFKEKTEELKKFSAKCKRVWLVMRKPTRKEYETVAKVTAVGILIVGAIGFLISWVMGIFI